MIQPFIAAALLVWMLIVPAVASEVHVAIGRSLPPYVIVEEWRGLEYDIVREALAAEGHTMRPHFTTFARVVRELELGQAAAAMTMRPDSGVDACYSESHISYRNYVITLAHRNLSIQSLDDLRSHSVMAFQNAGLYLGESYRRIVRQTPNYREEAQQALQPIMLFSERVDAVVADRNIFAWFAAQPDVTARVSTKTALKLHPIFPPTPYHVAFRSQELCDSFNRGLKKIRDNGLYDRIVSRYKGYLNEQ
jgi:polar amino acid transport system substrate-binding protein